MKEEERSFGVGLGAVQQMCSEFAVAIVGVHEVCARNPRARHMSGQMLHSGTKIGARVSQARYAATTNEFNARIHAALQQVINTIYWLELLKETDSAEEANVSSALEKAATIRILLSSLIKTRYENK